MSIDIVHNYWPVHVTCQLIQCPFMDSRFSISLHGTSLFMKIMTIGSDPANCSNYLGSAFESHNVMWAILLHQKIQNKRDKRSTMGTQTKSATHGLVGLHDELMGIDIVHNYWSVLVTC